MMNSREILEFITDNEKVTLSKLSQLMGIKRAQPLYDIRDGKIKSKRITARDYKNVVPFYLLSAFYVKINDLGEQTHC